MNSNNVPETIKTKNIRNAIISKLTDQCFDICVKWKQYEDSLIALFDEKELREALWRIVSLDSMHLITDSIKSLGKTINTIAETIEKENIA